jgi:hypothetical protein
MKSQCHVLFCLAVLGFELRASCLLGRHYVICVMPSALNVILIYILFMAKDAGDFKKVFIGHLYFF